MKEFPPFRLDTTNQCLWKRADAPGDERILMTPKAFAVLRYLVEHAGRLVTQDELIEAVWPDTYVQPEVLKYQVADIRSKLGDHPKNPLFIETLPRRGYQFIAGLKEWEPAGRSASENQAPSRLVGRDRELGSLRACFRRALSGQRQIVFVTGEPGIGKTALVDEFERLAIAGEPSIRIARGQCVEGFGVKEAYYPVLEALGQLCRGPDGNRAVETLAAQAPTWLVQFPALLKPEQRQALRQEILGATRDRMLREIREALDTLSSEAPLLLVLEDLQWADPSTVDLISALARQRTAAKTMLVGTKRPLNTEASEHSLKDLRQDLLVHHLCQEIALAPLGEAEVAEYLAMESQGGGLPEGFAGLIHRHSEGNPLFMLAVLDHMTEQGLISREDRKWRLKIRVEGIGIEVPDTLRQMIQTQIGRLSSKEQHVLEAASIHSVGRSRFAVAARAAAIELEPEAFEDVCETLSRRHSIVRAAEPEKFPDGTVSACYEFAHVLYREVCYRRIGPRRRALLHRRLGEWTEAHWEQRDEASAWLAGHFEQGGDWPRAIKYLSLAADTAGRRFEPRQAAEILKHALELVGKLPEAARRASEIEILEKLATIYSAIGEDAKAIEAYETLAARAARDALIDVEARAYIGMAWPLSWISSQRSLEILDRALRLSPRQGDPVLRARTRAHCYALRLWQRWNPQDAQEFRHAFAEIRNAGDRRILAPHLVDLSSVEWLSSEYREANRILIESRVIKLETVEENPYLSTEYLIAQCVVLPRNLLFLGEWGAALREIKDTIAILDKNADYHWGQIVRLYRAFVHLHAMDFSGALAICNSALPFVRDPEPHPAPDYPTPYPTALRQYLFLTGSAEAGLGNYEVARERLLMARAVMDRRAAVFGWWWRMQLEFALTELWLAKGDLAQARTEAETLLKIALTTAEHTWQALAWEAKARVAIAEGNIDVAQECVDQALPTIEGFEVPLAAWRVHATSAEVFRSHGNSELAERHSGLSRATIMKLADSLASDDPLRSTFLAAPPVRRILGDAVAIV